MVAAGVARKLVFSWLGNPGVGGLHAIRRAGGDGGRHRPPLELEEYSHFGMVGRYTAGAMNLPFFPLRSYVRPDLPAANPLIRQIASPYGDESIYAVPPLKPDVTIIHAQRADAAGDTQVWGLLGCQKEAAFAADAGDRGGRGAGRRVGHPRGPEPDHHPGPDRRRGGRRAVWARIPRTPRATTTGTTPSTSSGTPSRATRSALEAWLTSGSTGWTIGPTTSSKLGGIGWRHCGRAARRPAAVDYGDYR